MKFKVMSRKGHKQQVCTSRLHYNSQLRMSYIFPSMILQLKELNIPIDSGLAASLRDTQQVKETTNNKHF